MDAWIQWADKARVWYELGRIVPFALDDAWGALRFLGMTALGALVMAFFVTSPPLANVHVALAGYADLPMAAYYT